MKSMCLRVEKGGMKGEASGGLFVNRNECGRGREGGWELESQLGEQGRVRAGGQRNSTWVCVIGTQA